LRFAPASQHLKEEAASRIVERALLSHPSAQGATEDEIEQLIVECFHSVPQALARWEISAALRRLTSSNRARREGKAPARYGLVEEARSELTAMQQAAELRFSAIVKRLFGNADAPALHYAAPFLDSLCFLFSKLGEGYMDTLLGRTTTDVTVQQNLIVAAVEHAISKPDIEVDHDILSSGLIRFFQDSSGDTSAVKWNMAQNYFIMRTLGVHEGAVILSREVFGDTEAYFDTNVIIHALEPSARYHRSFQALTEACSAVGMTMNVAHPTLDELRKLVDYKRQIMEKVAGQVPAETLPKVRGLFLKLYLQEVREDPNVAARALFKSFGKAKKKLRRNYGIDYVDDKWFVDGPANQRVASLAWRIRQESKQRVNVKGKASALHDALLLTWVAKERERSAKTIYLVTLDRLLISMSSEEANSDEKPLAIGLDSLLQWIWPAAMESEAESEVAGIFSEALQFKLLPDETFFQESDFLMLEALQMQARHLPAAEVEECIRYLKKHASGLDPSNPRDREQMAGVLGGFFADPSRDHSKIVAQQQQTITELSQRLTDLEGEYKQRQRKKMAGRRTIRALVAGVLPAAVFGLSIWGAVQLGTGQTWYARLGDMFYIPSLALPLCLSLFRILLGKDGFKGAHWMIKRIFFAN
jgi:hypothetical protein